MFCVWWIYTIRTFRKRGMVQIDFCYLTLFCIIDFHIDWFKRNAIRYSRFILSMRWVRFVKTCCLHNFLFDVKSLIKHLHGCFLKGFHFVSTVKSKSISFGHSISLSQFNRTFSKWSFIRLAVGIEINCSMWNCAQWIIYFPEKHSVSVTNWISSLNYAHIKMIGKYICGIQISCYRNVKVDNIT